MKRSFNFNPIEINRNKAQHLILNCQFPSDIVPENTASSVYSVISHLGYIQIDTISVTERSVNHILWSRLGNFDREHITDLFKRKRIFEYWSHAAALLPMKDFRFSLVFKKHYAEKYSSFRKNNNKLLKFVKERIKSEGSLMSKHFDDTKTGLSGWWNRKPSKEALEFLFFSGELMVTERTGFQKVYDLTERVLPSGTDNSFPTEKEYHRYLIYSSIKANGLSTLREIAYLRLSSKNFLENVLNEMVEEKEITAVKIKGISDQIYFTFPDLLNDSVKKKSMSFLNILSPFDNFIIQRKRIKDLFDFDYQVECYVPSHKRKYGYFTLPVICGNEFIGRLDMKSDRKNDTLILNKFFPEKNIPAKIKDLLNKRVSEYAAFTGCSKVSGKI